MAGKHSGEVLVEAVDVCKSFGAFRALEDVSLEVRKGEVCCIIGPSGSGKSTFLRCINLLERIDSGAIWVNGELIGYRREGDRLYETSDAELSRQRRGIGMVFQRFNLFPHKTALGNIIEGPVQVLGESRKAAHEHAMELLDRVGLSDKPNNYPAELSGGQQQRVAIARALGMRPSLILFDEPTSALDPELVAEVLDVMNDLATSGMTMIVVTHEMGFARNVSNNVAFMDGGKLIEHGPSAQVLTQPGNPRTDDFLRAVQR